MSPRVVLVGPMGAGKSAVGALVAARLGVALRDTDADVEAAAGCTVAEVFATEGEAGFRRRERAAVAAALREHDGVLALGGGAVLDPATCADLRAHPVVLLTVTWEHVRDRVRTSGARPLLAGDQQQRWAAVLAARRQLYADVATVALDTDGLSPQAVAAKVLDVLGEVMSHNGGTAGRSSHTDDDLEGDSAGVEAAVGTVSGEVLGPSQP